jgi:hypothetical protein
VGLYEIVQQNILQYNNVREIPEKRSGSYTFGNLDVGFKRFSYIPI